MDIHPQVLTGFFLADSIFEHTFVTRPLFVMDFNPIKQHIN